MKHSPINNIQVQKIPNVRKTAIMSFCSLQKAANMTRLFIRYDIRSIVRCELLNKDAIRAANTVCDACFPEASALMLVEFHCHSDQVISFPISKATEYFVE